MSEGIGEFVPSAAVGNVGLDSGGPESVWVDPHNFEVDDAGSAVCHGVGHDFRLVSRIQNNLVNLVSLVVEFGVVVGHFYADLELPVRVVAQVVGLDVVVLVLEELDGRRRGPLVVVEEVVPVCLGVVRVDQRFFGHFLRPMHV